MTKELSKREIFMPSLKRIIFSFVPVVLFYLPFWIAENNFETSVYWIDVYILVPVLWFLYFVTWGMSQPFQIILDPIGWWSSGVFASPSDIRGWIVIVGSYVVIFYFLFAARRSLILKIRKIFFKTR